MKTLWLAAALALTLPSLTAMADPRMMSGPTSGMHGCHDHMGRMADTLGITDAQQKQIDNLHDQTHKDMRTLWRQKHKNMRAMMALNPDDKNYVPEVKKLAKEQADLTEKMIIARAQARAKFYAILTDAQKAKLKKMHEDRGGMHHHGMHGPMGGGYY
jgi:Spy/CpxP family protein refolding chaperone